MREELQFVVVNGSGPKKRHAMPERTMLGGLTEVLGKEETAIGRPTAEDTTPTVEPVPLVAQGDTSTTEVADRKVAAYPR